jgi:hypothetical protein
MQLTIQQLRAAVLEYVSAEWVRENFGKLTVKQTWQDAYDRCSEFIAAKADEAIEVAKEAASETTETVALLAEHAGVAVQDAIAETITYDNVVNLAFTITSATTKYAKLALIETLKVMIIGYLFILEMQEEGAIDELMAQVEELNNPPLWRRLQGIDSDRDLWGYDELRDPRLVLTVPIAG